MLITCATLLRQISVCLYTTSCQTFSCGKGDKGPLTCTAIFLRAVHGKVRQALMSVHGHCLGQSEKVPHSVSARDGTQANCFHWITVQCVKPLGPDPMKCKCLNGTEHCILSLLSCEALWAAVDACEKDINFLVKRFWCCNVKAFPFSLCADTVTAEGLCWGSPEHMSLCML